VAREARSLPFSAGSEPSSFPNPCLVHPDVRLFGLFLLALHSYHPVAHHHHGLFPGAVMVAEGQVVAVEAAVAAGTAVVAEAAALPQPFLPLSWPSSVSQCGCSIAS
jgi:hypothetical protein